MSLVSNRNMIRTLLTSGWCVLAAAAIAAETAPNLLRLRYERPAGTWEEALPVGNGRLGAMQFGGAAEERLQLNEATLWGGQPHDYANTNAGKLVR